ncbi:S8 family serine peptidase [Shewanella sp. Isolate11]|uniref:S8 family serine peptidase n=1 Tax=Shewanella sp. Isolate11 TaxID=2908530 RepID=UPI001EFDF2DB|nr:S8 family serine peptidase [Shewanella sp. Isolate11]MCG9697711.1 S8 family serine peptidase [Shewanella sp. Isolate11]
MKISGLKASALALSIASAFAAQAADDRYIIQVENNSKGIVKALAKKIGGEVHVDADGFIAATFAGKDLAQVKGLLNNPHVKLVEEDAVRKPMALYNDDVGNPNRTQVTPYAYYQSQADQLAYQGGMKVCVIDSGLDRSNTDFNWVGITGDNDSGTGNWDEAGGAHGTHVAGTIGAADNDTGVIGMAPGIDMHIIKVFNADGWGYSSDLAQATQLCSDAGANIINMSLGGGSPSNTESYAMENFVAAGGLVVAAAGNNGSNVRSFPAGYPSVMMVGANDADNNIADFSQFPDCGKGNSMDESRCVEVTAGGVNTLSTYPAQAAAFADINADDVAYAASGMEIKGIATGNTYHMGLGNAVDSGANGQICVIDRGEIAFYDKASNCQASGGIGAIVINNVDGMLYGTLGDNYANIAIPVVGADLADRDALINANVATVIVGDSDYGYMNGTSMATPAVSGLAALVWSHYPECSGEGIRNALRMTAEDSGDAGHDVYFGYGIVKAKAAYDYIAANGCPVAEAPEFTLSVITGKQRGSKYVDLSWTGTASEIIHIYRNNQRVDAIYNDGDYRDSFSTKGKATFTYKVCEYDTGTCSNEVDVKL